LRVNFHEICEYVDYGLKEKMVKFFEGCR